MKGCLTYLLRPAGILSLLLLVGCKSTDTIVLPEIFRDTVYQVQHHHDSTYIDRWHTVETKGDTVYKTETEYRYRYITRTDTVNHYIEKPVEIVRTQTVEVEKPLTWWQRTQQRGFWLLLAAFALLAIYFYTKHMKSR